MTLETRSSPSDEFQTGKVVWVAAAHAVHDTYSGFLPPLLPTFILELGISRAGAGLLTIFLRAPSLLQPLIGHLAERTGLRYLVILAPAVTTLMMSLIGIAPTYAALALFLSVAGISSAAMHAVGPVMVGDLSGRRDLGRGMSFWMVGGELGRVLGPLVIGATFGVLGLQGMPWLMLGGLLTSLALYFLLRDFSNGVPRAIEGRPWREALRGMGPFMLILAGVVTARAFVVEALSTYLPLFLTEEGASLWLASSSLAVFEAAGVVGAFFGGSLSDRLGRRRVLAGAMLAATPLMLAFMRASGWLQFPLLLLLGFTTLSLTPVIMALVQESFPENRALANGFYMALSFVLRSLVTLLLGRLGDTVGMRSAYTVSALAPLLGLPLILLLTATQRR